MNKVPIAEIVDSIVSGFYSNGLDYLTDCNFQNVLPSSCLSSLLASFRLAISPSILRPQTCQLVQQILQTKFLDQSSELQSMGSALK